MLLFQDAPQRGKIWLGQGNLGGKDCYLTRKAKQDRQSWEQRLTSCKITAWPDRKPNIAIWLQKGKTPQCKMGKIRMHKKDEKMLREAHTMTVGNNESCTFQSRALMMRQWLVPNTTGPRRKEVLEGDNGTMWQGSMAGMCRGSQGRHGEVKKEPMAMVTWGEKGRCCFMEWGCP